MQPTMIVYQPENLPGLISKVEALLGERLLGHEEKSHYTQFRVMGADAKVLVRFLKEDESLGFTHFIDLTCVDYSQYPVLQPGRFAIVITLLSVSLGIKVQVKAFVSAEAPRIPSLTDLFKGANWTEREVWDLYGVEFLGHPDLKRILMPDDFDGHPLRKDYPLKGRGERGNFPVYHATQLKPKEGE